jgi:hypothetical protein
MTEAWGRGMSDRFLIFLSVAFILLAVWGGEPFSSVVDPFIQSLNRISTPVPNQEGASVNKSPYPPPDFNRHHYLPMIKKN